MPAGMLAERDKVVEGLGEAEGPFVATEERGRTCQVRHLDGILLTADCNPLFTSCTTPLTALSKWRQTDSTRPDRFIAGCSSQRLGGNAIEHDCRTASGAARPAEMNGAPEDVSLNVSSLGTSFSDRLWGRGQRHRGLGEFE
jgi:hypothetical protein